MPITPRFRVMPTTALELERVFQGTEVRADDGSVVDTSFAARAGNSVIGRATNTGGIPGDIGISAGQFLGNRANVIGGYAILDTDLPPTIARDSEVTAGDAAVTAAFVAADAAHVAASDPHTQYRQESASVPWGELSGVPAVLANIYTGTGTPEGAVTAGVGSLYLRQDGGALTTLYVKETGTGNTGWVGK